ncbi:MAG: phospholipid carrier-dependent glycosyltransferase [Chloroflexota bacterium]|nr:phospholipid carrier-dependent glycosyltransferase [Chloroflexota bacterium]
MPTPASHHDPNVQDTGDAVQHDGTADSRRNSSAGVERASVVLLALVIFGIAFFHYRSDAGTNITVFHRDESRWINRAHYAEELLDPFGPTWNDYYLTRGQPPVGSYVMGIGLMAQGVDLDTNRAWEYRRSPEWNVQNGMYPTQEEIRAGRMTNVFLGSVAVATTFFAIRMLSNTVGGIVGAAILTFHPLQSWHNRLALADTTLTLTISAIVLLTILLFRKPGWFRALAIGILIGLGGANKLTPLALAFVFAAVGTVLLVNAILRNRQSLLPGETWLSAVPGLRHLCWMLVSMPIVAGASFVAAYPYLWSSPITNTLRLVDFRQNEMAEQARIYPQFSVESTGEAINRTWLSLGDRWSATGWTFRWLGYPDFATQVAPLDLILAIIGTSLLTLVAIRSPIQSGHLMVGLLLLVQVGTIILSMRTDFERYYLPIVLAIAILAGTGVGISVRMLTSALQFRRHPARDTQPRSHDTGGAQTRASGS